MIHSQPAVTYSKACSNAPETLQASKAKLKTEFRKKKKEVI
jgi:hypothetical protein